MTTLTINRGNNRAIYTYTSLPYTKRDNLCGFRQLRYGSVGAAAESRRRAFRRASDLLYLYQDLFTSFVTLTYRDQHHNISKVTNDFKNYFSRKGITYVAVVEKHRSGNYHIHAITSDLPDCYESDYFVVGHFGRPQRQIKWRPWENNLGITDVKFISGTDNMFRIEKYIFKYMSKSEKIGGRYFYKSRDLKIQKTSSYQYHGYLQDMYVPEISNGNTVDHSEIFSYNVNNINITGEKIFYDRY